MLATRSSASARPLTLLPLVAFSPCNRSTDLMSAPIEPFTCGWPAKAPCAYSGPGTCRSLRSCGVSLGIVPAARVERISPPGNDLSSAPFIDRNELPLNLRRCSATPVLAASSLAKASRSSLENDVPPWLDRRRAPLALPPTCTARTRGSGAPPILAVASPWGWNTSPPSSPWMSDRIPCDDPRRNAADYSR